MLIVRPTVQIVINNNKNKGQVMYSLIITVRSIAALARLGCENSVLAALRAYLQHTADNLVHDADYSVPSLIWPPPTNGVLAFIYVPIPQHYPPLSPSCCLQQLWRDSSCVLR
jgi:hypothetical protein